MALLQLVLRSSFLSMTQCCPGPTSRIWTMPWEWSPKQHSLTRSPQRRWLEYRVTGGSSPFMCRYSTVHDPVHWPCCSEWQEVHYSSCAGTVLYTTLYIGPVAQSDRRFITLHVQVQYCTWPCTLALLLRVTGGSLLFMCRYSTVHDPVHWPCCSEWQDVHYSSCAGTQLYTTLYIGPVAQSNRRFITLHVQLQYCTWPCTLAPVAQTDRRFITLHVQVQYCTRPCTLALLLRVTGGSLLLMCRYNTVHDPVHLPCCSK